MLQDQLLQPEECSLVIDALSDLHAGHPHVLGFIAMAFRAEMILKDDFNDEDLLEDGPVKDLMKK